ncbi:MAG TPA: efflux RND transporter periplasmic adaptor subunit [Usitatibacteraceae bacterium]|nr:efflux RND transporter periplasmic adaptor subunit [Usitatibacteraceae bacterium]
MSAQDLSRLQIDRGAKSFGPRRRPRWLKFAIVAAIVAAIAAAVALRSAMAPVTVDVATVTTAFPSQGFTVLNATGRVVAWRKAAISTKATGRLEWLGVQEGTRVKAGQVIARLESLDVAATRDSTVAGLNAARANLEQGEAEMRDADSAYKRAQDLFEKKFISESTLDTARARAEKARASVSSLKAAIGVANANVRSASVSVEQTLIRAPFDGIVLTKNANVGDIITPFSSAADSKGAVVNMADMETLEVEADVSESSISKIAVGMPTEIQLDAYPELRLLGEVSRIVPTVDRSKATLLVKVAFKDKDPRALPDMSAKVGFLQRAPDASERKAVIAVRPEAIAMRGGKPVVFVLDKDNKVKQTPVTVARKLGDLLEIAGASPGDKVALSPPEKLKDGATVALLKK